MSSGAIEQFTMVDESGNKKDVVAGIIKFPQRHERMLRNYFGKSMVDPDSLTFGSDLRVGQIEDYVLQHTIKSVEVDGTKVDIDKNQSVMDQLPTLEDPDDENWDSLGERLVRLVVKHNKRLARHPRYRQVFVFYADEDTEKEDPNPTTSGASSTSTSKKEDSPQKELSLT